jgi:arylformamidase
MKKIIDISWPLSGTSTTYKNKQHIIIEKKKTFSDSGVRESALHLNTHAGTHIDAPAHFLADGETVEHVKIESIIGPCRVINLQHISTGIERKDLDSYNIKQSEIILLQTKNSLLSPDELFNPNFTYLSESGARYLSEQKVKAIGIDYLGVERNQSDHETHKVLLSNNITIIEGLRLNNVKPGSYNLYCLPLKLIGTEAAPARAILI